MNNDKFLEIQNFAKMSSRGWDDLKDKNTYEYKKVIFPFGIRTVAVASERTKLLQASRGQSFGKDTISYEQFLINYQNDSKEFHDFDKLRILEIMKLNEDNLIKLDSKKCFYEYGFRSTSVMNFWKSFFSNVRGCDVVNPCVNASRDLGYETELIDLNYQTPNLKNVGLISAYHVLEHLSNPLECIQKTYNSIEKGCVFHVEIPIEPDGPRIRYGHLFPFHKNDLAEMMRSAGFKIIKVNDTPFQGGPEIERVTSIKE